VVCATKEGSALPAIKTILKKLGSDKHSSLLMNKKGGKDLYHVVDGWRDGARTRVGHGGVWIRHNVDIVVQPIIIQCILAGNSP
jgi:hypothetical protein